jgi:monoamine oxidase
VTRYAAKLGAAHGCLHFCGEHLAVESRGMEGAMESGERAAAAVLDRA